MRKSIVEGFQNVVILMSTKDFRVLWFAGGIYHITRWMDPVVMGLVMWELTGSASQVAILLALKWSPMLIFASIAGYLSMAFNRKILMLITQGGTVTILAIFAILALYELILPWHLKVGAFGLGVFYVLDFPAKRTAIHDVSRSNRLSNAMFLDIINHALGKGVGPFLAGLTIQFLGPVGAFSLLLILASTSFSILTLYGYKQEKIVVSFKQIGPTLVNGFVSAFSNKIVFGALLASMVFNWFVFSCEALLPVVAVDDLQVNAFWAGILVSAFGTGCLFGGLSMSFIGNIELKGRVLVGGFVIQMIGFIVFGWANIYLVCYAFLFMAGFGNALLSAMSTPVVMLNVEEKDRSMTLGVVAQCVGAAALGGFTTSRLAEMFGAGNTMIINQGLGFTLLAIILLFTPLLTNRT